MSKTWQQDTGSLKTQPILTWMRILTDVHAFDVMGSCSVEEEEGGCSAAQLLWSVQPSTWARWAHAGLHWAAPVINTQLEQHISAVHDGSHRWLCLCVVQANGRGGGGGGVLAQGALQVAGATVRNTCDTCTALSGGSEVAALRSADCFQRGIVKAPVVVRICLVVDPARSVKSVTR